MPQLALEARYGVCPKALRQEGQRDDNTKIFFDDSACNSSAPVTPVQASNREDEAFANLSSSRPRGAAFAASCTSSRPTLICSLGKCIGCEGSLIAHISRISCSRCSGAKSITQVIDDFDKSSSNHKTEQPERPKRRRDAVPPKHRGLQGVSSNFGSEFTRRLSQTSIPWSPAVSSLSDGSFLQEVYKEENPRAVLDASPLNVKLKTPVSELGSQAQKLDSSAIAANGGDDQDFQDSPSYYESPEMMRGSRTSSASNANVSEASVNVRSHYGDRMDRAVKLMAGLKKRLVSKPELLEAVLAILYAVIGNHVGILEARQQMQELLSDIDHADLLHEVLLFLPIPEDEDADGQKRGDDYSDDFVDEDLEESANFDGSDGARRDARKRPFSETEIENLQKGVKRFGFGKWRKILQTYLFDRRTAVNLKDAYRVIERRRWKETKRKLDEITPTRRGAFDPSPGSQRRRLLPR